MIELSQIYKSFDNGKTFALRDVSLTVAANETLVILGSSGCGKTTVLKLINRLLEPTSGKIMIDGQDIMAINRVALRRSIGYVFQGVGLFPHMTVEENVAIVLRLNKRSQPERIARAHELLELVNLNPTTFAKRFPHELSGGQQQRVGVARSLAGDPKLLLMDEPFGALDAISRDALQNEILKIKQRLHKTIVFVTHDILEALRLGDRIAVMNKGRIEQIGVKEEILQNPATEFVRELFAKQRKQLNQLNDAFNGFESDD